MNRLNEILKSARTNRNISQGELAFKLGFTSPQFVSNWERGLCVPPLKKMKQVIRLLNLDPKDVMVAMGEDYMKKVWRALK